MMDEVVMVHHTIIAAINFAKNGFQVNLLSASACLSTKELLFRSITKTVYTNKPS